MPSFDELRATLKTEQRGLLDEIWGHFRTEKEWPNTWDFHSPNRKKAVQEFLKPLGGSIVLEQPDSQHGGRYCLSLLGVLLTKEGATLENLLVRYFDFMRGRYKARLKDRIIYSREVQSELRLDDVETQLLGRLIMLGNIFSQSAEHSGKWEKKDWSAGILHNVEDFPSEGSLEEELEKFVFRHYDPEIPVLMKEQQHIKFLPQAKTQSATNAQKSEVDPRIVFVVHGRNESLRKAMFDFLRSLNLKPLEWSQAIANTGAGTPYIGEILDKAFLKAQAVVVLMTPDDEAYLKKEFQTDGDEPHERELTGQARANVLFEAGMAMGHNANRTVLVQVGKLRPFSDISGRHIIHLNNSTERRQDLADRLKAAGCEVDLSGRDWHSVGSFKLQEATDTFVPKAILPLIEEKFTPEEIEIITSTPSDGSIHLAHSSSYGLTIAHHSKKFFDPYDGSVQAKYLDAFDRIQRKGLVRMENPNYYKLTGKGFEIKKTLVK